MISERRALTSPEAKALLGGLGASGAGQKVIDRLQFPEKLRWSPATVGGAVFRDVDWRHALMGFPFLRKGNLTDCRFEKVDFDGISCWRVGFHRCSFESSTLGREHFGIFKRCSFTECTFLNCRLDLVTFAESTFRSCRFEEIRARRTRWDGCLLDQVVLSGILIKTNFIRSGFSNVDMSDAELQDSSLVYTTQGDVRLPDRPDNFAIDAQLFLDAEAALRSKLDDAAQQTYRELAKTWSPFGSPFIVYQGVVDELAPADRAVVMSTLYDMRHQRPLRVLGGSVAR